MTRTRFARALSLAAVLVMVIAPALTAPAAARDPRAPWHDAWRDAWGAPPWVMGAVPPPAALMAGFGDPCGGLGVRWIDRATAYATGFMDLTADQAGALRDLKAAARHAAAKGVEICHGTDYWKETAPERLKHQEEALAAARDAVREVRPKFEAVYYTLSPGQRATLDAVLAGRRPIPWGWWNGDH